MSAAPILTLGYGSFSSVNFLPTIGYGGYGIAPAPVVVITGQTPAGKRTRRHYYALKVDGVDRIFASLDALLAFLDSYEEQRIEEVARKAVDDAKRVLSLGKAKAKPKPPQVSIESPVAEIREYVDEVQKKIDRMYWNALADAMARDAEEEDDILTIASIL